MVERPIKKSDRQNVAGPSNAVKEIKKPEQQNVAGPSDTVEQVLETESSPTEDSPRPITQSSEPRKIILPVVGKDKTRGKGKGEQKEDSRSTPPGNPALARGPKPTKAKPPVIIKDTQSANAEESATEPEQETTVEG